MRAKPADAVVDLRARQQSPAARRRIVRSERGAGVDLPACATRMLAPADFSLQENYR